jgi:hypothetical protein
MSSIVLFEETKETVNIQQEIYQPADEEIWKGLFERSMQ